MQRLAFRLLLILFVALFSQPFTRPQNNSPDTETTLRSVVDELFVAYAREDIDGYLKLWSAKSPDLTARRKSMQDLFTANDKIEVKTLNFRKVNPEGEKASVRVTVDMSALDAKTGKPAQGFGKMNRALDFVREQGQWKVWKEEAAEANLAAALVAAKTDDERTALLQAERELITPELWKALIRQGKQQYSQSNYKQALRIDELAKSIAEQIGDTEGIAQAFNDMGAVQDSQGNYGLAIEYFQRSLVLRKTLGDKVNMAISLANLGSVYGSQGNHRLASEYYQKALVEFELVKHNVGLGAVLNSIGNTYFFQGNYGLASENYEKALKYFQAAGHKAGEAVALNNMGNVRQRQGDSDSALDYYQKSLKVKEALGNKAGIGASLNNIGKNYRLRGKYDLAFEYFQTSLAQFGAIGDPRGEALTLGEIGLLYYSKGDYAKALEFAERAAVIAAKMDLREVLWEARTTSGRAYRLLNQPVQARRSFEEAIATVESWRTQVAGGEQEQQRFFEDKVSPYQLMVELLVEQNHAGEALAFAERSKGRVLLDVLRSSSSVNITKAMTAQEQEQERSLRSELVSLNSQVSRERLRAQPDHTRSADLNARLQKARLRYESFQTTLYAAHPELRVQRGEAKTLTLEDAGGLVEHQDALLEYVVTDKKTYLFVLTAETGASSRAAKLKSYTLSIARNELAEHVKAFRQQLARRDLTFRATASKLYDLLLRPALAELRGKRTLVIVPDGVLWELPFQTLTDPNDRYLIEDHAISYAPSLTVLREMTHLRKQKQTANRDMDLLAIGNPELRNETTERVKSVHRDERLEPLPQAETEVKTLGQLYGARSTVYIGADAREDRFKTEARRFKVVHLATHGILNDSSPMYSQIVLAHSDESEDGLLEAWEIMKLDLNADLVVLSACESGRGRVGAGEGVIGL
ncbi:MAG TPA: CHAT domain-containing protein, partial [Pyrinomonadaceae bacterium]